MLSSLLKDACVVGLSTLVSAAALQLMYRKTKFYPPNPVFWFFTGFSGYLLIEAVEHQLGRELIDTQHLLSKPTV